MMAQSALSFVTVILVVARAVNTIWLIGASASLGGVEVERE